MYTILFDDPFYKSWTIFKNDIVLVDLGLDLDLSPIKLLNGDKFSINLESNVDGNNDITIIESPIRQHKNIAGILDLSKTYGRENKLLYLCKPDDIRLPYFLIPYNIPPSFDKTKNNLYITFQYKHWDNLHPHGVINQNIGTVLNPEHFYEYMLYCKGLNVSIQPFTKAFLKSIKSNESNENDFKNIINNICEKYGINTRTDRVFTIDSSSSIDLDDGISIKDNIISIYISYVPIIIEYLNLWDSFTDRTSTIYLPDKKRPLIPLILSQLCSLNENEERICLIMDIVIENGKLISNTITTGKVKIHKNYSYDDLQLLKNPDYNKIKNMCNYENSHDMVTELMIYFNTECANRLKYFKTGIYKNINNNDISKLTNRIARKLSDYTYYSPESNYAQFTSPIRRLVDILNIIQLGLHLFIKGIHFYNTWYSRLDFMNLTMKNIRKTQSKCKLLDLFTNNAHQVFKGVVFDKYLHNKHDIVYKYNVYLPELDIITNYTKSLNEFNELNELIINNEYIFKIFVFHSEGQLKKKIKLQLQ